MCLRIGQVRGEDNVSNHGPATSNYVADWLVLTCGGWGEMLGLHAKEAVGTFSEAQVELLSVEGVGLRFLVVGVSVHGDMALDGKEQSGTQLCVVVGNPMGWLLRPAWMRYAYIAMASPWMRPWRVVTVQAWMTLDAVQEQGAPWRICVGFMRREPGMMWRHPMASGET